MCSPEKEKVGEEFLCDVGSEFGIDYLLFEELPGEIVLLVYWLIYKAFSLLSLSLN